MASIYAKFIVEIAGKPVENVEKALKAVSEQLEEQKDDFKVVECHIEKPVLDEKSTLYAGFLDIELKFKEFNKIFGFILDYTPTSIEIIEPEKIEFSVSDLNTHLNEVAVSTLKTQGQLRQLNAYAISLKKQLEEKK